MSGGTFNNGLKYDIQDAIERIEYELEYHVDLYLLETIQHMQDGIKALKTAKAYAECIDKLIACDYGEESFVKALKEQL